jgi:hypothetical protein
MRIAQLHAALHDGLQYAHTNRQTYADGSTYLVRNLSRRYGCLHHLARPVTDVEACTGVWAGHLLAILDVHGTRQTCTQTEQVRRRACNTHE